MGFWDSHHSKNNVFISKRFVGEDWLLSPRGTRALAWALLAAGLAIGLGLVIVKLLHWVSPQQINAHLDSQIAHLDSQLSPLQVKVDSLDLKVDRVLRLLHHQDQTMNELLRLQRYGKHTIYRPSFAPNDSGTLPSATAGP